MPALRSDLPHGASDLAGLLEAPAKLARSDRAGIAAFGGEVSGESAERGGLSGLARGMDHEAGPVFDEPAGLGDACFGRDDVVAYRVTRSCRVERAHSCSSPAQP